MKCDLKNGHKNLSSLLFVFNKICVKNCFYLDETSKKENINLKISYYTLLVTISKTISEAEDFAKVALIICPTNFDPLVTLGVRYFVEDQEQKALDVFNQIIQADPNHPYAK